MITGKRSGSAASQDKNETAVMEGMQGFLKTTAQHGHQEWNNDGGRVHEFHSNEYWQENSHHSRAHKDEAMRMDQFLET
eukprot:11092917-Lingulodinium_polyedra.AAC.2